MTSMRVGTKVGPFADRSSAGVSAQVKGVAETVGTRAWQEPELERAAWEVFLKVSHISACLDTITLWQLVSTGMTCPPEARSPGMSMSQHVIELCIRVLVRSFQKRRLSKAIRTGLYELLTAPPASQQA